MSDKLFSVLAGVKSGSSFVSIVYTKRGTAKGPLLLDEKARYLFVRGISLESLYVRDLAALDALAPTLHGLEADAAELIAESRRVSLALGIGNNPAYTGIDTYAPTSVEGVTVHKVTGERYIFGSLVSKKVLKAGLYRKVNSRPATIARRAVEARLPSASYRKFCLSGVSMARLVGKTIVLK